MTVFVLICCVGILFFKYRNAVKKRKAIMQERSINHTNQSDRRSAIDDQDYDVVDERAMVDIIVPAGTRNEYMEVVSGSNSIASSKSNYSNLSGYLRPAVHAQEHIGTFPYKESKDTSMGNLKTEVMTSLSSYECLANRFRNVGNTYNALSPVDHNDPQKNQYANYTKS